LVGPKFAEPANSGLVGGILDPVDRSQGLPTVFGPGSKGETENGDQDENAGEESFHVAGGWHKEQQPDPDKQDFIL
jgi:hypothetical protein